MNQPALPLQISAELGNWLQTEQLSLGLSTYQTNRLMMVGSNSEGRLALNERLFDKPMGLYVKNQSLYMSTRYQIWRFDNCLQPRETYQEADRLYRPSQSYITGGLNVHDLVLDKNGSLLFVNTDYSCLATLEEGHSFKPLWQPPFIKKLVSQDSCHLNGLAMVDGEPRYMTACGETNKPAGWRNHRQNGGIILDISSSEIIATGLSMPHSPRWHDGKLWLLNSGTGELGYIEAEKFVPVTFCPGFVRGLTFWKHWTIVGLSQLRSKNFGGLRLEERLNEIGQTPQCGVMVIDLRTGEIAHSLIFAGVIEELYDVVVIPGVTKPRVIGFQDEDIERLITYPGCQGLITTKPAVKRPSLGPKAPIPGLATKERVERENQEAREIEDLERQAELAAAPVKYQRVYHLNPESLVPYDNMTFPSLQQRWQQQPQRGEVVGVSASRLGDLVGFVIGEQLSPERVEIISFNVDPSQRRQGIGLRMLQILEQQLVREGVTQFVFLYPPIADICIALEPLLQQLGWQPPTMLSPQVKGSHKTFAKAADVVKSSTNVAVNDTIKQAFQAGKQLAQAGQLKEAVEQFQSVLYQQPNYIPALNQLGNAWQQLGELDKAIACYQQVLEINPNMAVAHCNLGSIWQMQGKYKEAIAAYQKAIELKSDFVLAYRNLASLYTSYRQFQRAEMVLWRLLEFQPEDPENHQLLGNILRQMGHLEEAISCFKNAIKLNPQFSEAYYSLGCLLITKGQLNTAKQYLQKILKTPLDQLSFNPSFVYSSLGFILENQNKFLEALHAYNQSLQLNPEATEIFYQREHLRLILCDWDDFDHRMQILTERIQNHLETPHSAKLTPLSLNSFGAPIALHTTVNRHWSQTITEAMAELKAHCGFTPRRFNREKIRLGYLSADFRSHAVGSLIADIFQYHDRNLFEVYGYSLADTTDETTKIIQKGCDFFVNIASLSVEAGARRIYADEIDILIDLGGYTTSCRPEILALQPAPIQMQYLGYPNTMGAEFIQYILSDRQIIPPELTPYYTEQVIELPQAFIASPVEITKKAPPRSALGLPEKGFVYCCFNRTDKFDPYLFTVWMRILQQVPDSVLWLKDISPEITQKLRQDAQSQGVAPERLVFLSNIPLADDFIAHYQRADLFLDTFNYSAASTAIAALQSGLPILTCPGETFASRMGASICHTVGLDDFICESPQSYEEQAIYWGTHPQELQAIRDNLLQTKGELPLFQPKQWVRNLESVLQSLCSGDNCVQA
ncbi:TIGR03032 family protein [Synechocystis salina]|uniref:protein O-GlcNAc transferase n=1 Tax=Synechocystis salina LEGE 00031 TaxID=1828736 RepID=A0ABR9VWX7_9SYNC|nr:TIGR03032 family protein [Synechocystis salina]MBE9241442.1 TIGR03032 family protein [Synechocystis salina LEGE 00041]MBE9254751.1 TIGR03032 family protein [Synechocystis salina LEGE 00031]